MGLCRNCDLREAQAEEVQEAHQLSLRLVRIVPRNLEADGHDLRSKESSIQETVDLKLHKLEYNRFPKILGQISAKTVESIEKVEVFWLQYVFKGYEQLPINYNNQHLSIIYK